ncbi:chitobiase/beta-hexosaminidase C-terminal domain-containing protein [Ammoniphilus resinae]|uniref:chitobiase/beta-hexosaminidase C-terminal domain-containing protein n=1 Tax=Ammoniphilus resinae TaxID=861532 RepID=UPI0031586673
MASGMQVSLTSATASAVVYYTTDLSEPTTITTTDSATTPATASVQYLVTTIAQPFQGFRTI